MRLGTIALCAALSAAGARAHADSPTDAEIAARYAVAGDTAFAQARYPDAIEAYRSAARVTPRAELDFDLARCDDRLGRRADAVQGYEHYLAEAHGAAHDDEVHARLAALRDAQRPRSPRVQTPAIVVGVATVTAAAIGAGVYTSGLDADNALKTACMRMTCTASTFHSAHVREVAGEAMFGVAGAGLVVDVALWVIWARERRVQRLKP